MKLEVPETFEDIAVDFSAEEWKMLNNQEKELHREVMVQNYEHMVSVGFIIPKEKLLLLFEKHGSLASDVLEEAMTTLQMDTPEVPPNRKKGSTMLLMATTASPVMSTAF
ncbi:KRAB domain-containing protein 4-like [Protopterus annectens]|uniref:KRAB domain-containing protein 4-like n=1 Tax=Protopterus annectens TaxID=7888 RepID=UPI001CF94311|nr:KRAB domain-containing protein 4-like [Protopterus annectens]